jgi:hypothetical protein
MRVDSMTPLPAFYYHRAVPDDAAVLEEGEGFLVTRNNGVVAIQCFALWKPEWVEVYRRHGAEGVRINMTTTRWRGLSLDFLRRLPNLRCLDLGIDVPLDITLLGELEGLEHLGLQWRAKEPPELVDFRRLDRLSECLISWHPVFAQVLKLRTIRILWLFDAPGLKVLDASGLPGLAELVLISCPALTRIDLSDQAKLLSLELANCAKLVPNWSRIATDLRYLSLGGKIGFAVAETAKAQALQYLWTTLPNRHTSDVVALLRALPCLDGVSIIDLKVKKEAVKQIKSFNEAHGHGATMTARPPRYLL